MPYLFLWELVSILHLSSGTIKSVIVTCPHLFYECKLEAIF